MRSLCTIACVFLPYFLVGQCDSGNGLRLFWRAGSGDFNDPTRWEVGFAGSGVSPCQSPRSGDDVTFPASAFGSAATITVGQNANCRTMYWEAGAAVSPTIEGSTAVNLDIYGDMALSGEVIFGFNGNLRFKSVAAAGTTHDINTAGKNLTLRSLVIEPSELVEYRLLGELRLFRPTGAGTSTYSGGSIFLNSGYLNTNAQYVRAEGFCSITGVSNRRLNISGSRVEVVRNDRFDGREWVAWNVDFNTQGAGNLVSFEAAGSHILVNNSNGSTSWLIMGTGLRYDSISFGPTTATPTTSSYVEGVADTFHYIAAYRRMGAEPWTVVTDELHLYENAHIAGTGTLNLTVDAVVVHGGCDAFPTIGSSGLPVRSAGNGWNGVINLKKLTPGVLNLEQLILGRVNADLSGGRSYIAQRCADKGGNNNVTFLANPTRHLYFRDYANDQNWHTLANWETWDGAVFTAATCLPTPFDDVYFDGASFPNALKRVILNKNAACHAMRWLPTVSASAQLRMSTGFLNMFGSLEWASTMPTTSFVGGYSIVLCSPNRDSIISNNAINNNIPISLENNADYHIHGDYSGLIYGGPNSMLRMAAHQLRPYNGFQFSQAAFDGTQIYTDAGVRNSCASITYAGNAVWHFLLPASNTASSIWVCQLPETIIYANAQYYIYHGTINILGNLTIQEDARLLFGYPAQYSGSLNAIGGLNGAPGNVTVHRGAELAFVNYNPTSSRIAGDLNLLGDCQKTTTLQTLNGLPLASGFRVAGAANIQNAYIRGINNTSLAPNTTINAINSTDGSNNSGFNFIPAASLTFYWRASNTNPADFTGNWSSPGHWTTNPANTTGDNGCVPSAFDDVVFDNLSLSATSNGCTISSPSFCRDLLIQSAAKLHIESSTLNCRNFTVNHPNAILFSPNINPYIFINQNLTLAPNMTAMNYRGTIEFIGNSGNITSNGTRIEARMLNFNNPNGHWFLQDELFLANDWAGTNSTNSQAGELRLSAGHLHTNNHPLTISSFLNANIGNATRGLHLGSSTFTHRVRAPHQNNGVANWVWYINSTNFTLSSNPDAQIIIGPNTLYNNNASVPLSFYSGNNLQYPNLRITENEQPFSIYNNASFNYLELEGNFYIDGNNTVDSLRLEGGYFYRFRAGSTQNLRAPHGKVIANGTNSNFVNIESSAASQPFTLRKAYGEAFCIDFVKVKDCIGQKETNMALITTSPTDYQFIQPFLEFQTGTNSDNIGGTATGIWAFNLPPLVIPQYNGNTLIDLCRFGSTNTWPITFTGTSPYVLNYAWTDNSGGSGNQTLLLNDDDNNPNTPFAYTTTITSPASQIYYQLDLSTSRCGNFTPATHSYITVSQASPNILVATPRQQTCDFNNEDIWLTLIDPVDHRPIASLLDQVDASDNQPLGNVTTEVFFDPTVQYYFDGTNSYPYLQRHWQITPTHNSPAKVRLYFTQAELNALALQTYAGSYTGTLNPATDLVLRKFSGNGVGSGTMTTLPFTVIVLAGPNAAPFSSTTDVIAIEFTVPSFSHFILTPTLDILLDQQLQSFSAQPIEKQVALNWTCSQTQNISYFELERSSDATHGQILAQIPSHRLNQNDTYSYLDAQPLHGYNYYRLRSIDDDGQTLFSDWKAVQMYENAPFLQLLPNPSNGQSQILLASPSALRIEIYNPVGQRIATQEYPEQTSHNLDFGSLASGVYVLRIYFPDGSAQALRWVIE